jgi:hypothetical protein
MQNEARKKNVVMSMYVSSVNDPTLNGKKTAILCRGNLTKSSAITSDTIRRKEKNVK